MKRNVFWGILTVLLIAGIGAGGGYWYAMRRMHTEMSAPPATPTDSPITTPAEKTEPSTDRKALYWHDPMVPGPKFDKPGKSPFMNMQLVPVYADEGADQGKVTINSRTLQNLGIRIADVKEGRMEMGFTTTGAVSVDERSLTAVQVRVNGYIEKLYVRAQYDTVTRGQPIADIYSPDWLAAQDEYLVLKRSTQPGTDGLAQAARQRLVLLGISEAHIQRIEQSGQPAPRVTVHAPDSGIVWELAVREGMSVNPGMPLLRLAALGSVWVNAEVPETEAALVRPGTPVTARTSAFPDAVYKGTVAALLPDVSATTRTIKARIVLVNANGRLKPGMFATVEFGSTAKPALMIPTEAVIHTGKRTVVIVAEDGGKFRPVDVETGRESTDMTEIRKGLSSGQKVVASGQFLIDSEASLKTTLTRLESAQSPGTNDAAPGKHTGSAKITGIDAAKGKIDLNHGPIPSMKWPAMSMGFRVEDKSQLSNIKPGDEIEFELRGEPDKDGDYTITRITRKSAKAAK
jgi:Cu(I)/Ag(I) efflux system membrane fusion protein